MELRNINTIGVIMFGLLGDVLMRTPVLKALKEIYPESKVIAICDTMAATILHNNAFVDGIVTIDKKKFFSKVIGTIKVRSLKCDLLIDLYNGGSSSNITLLSGAKYRLGYQEQKNSSYYNILSEGIANKTKDVYSYNEQIISILTPLSKNKFDLKPVFEISHDVNKKVNAYLEKFNVDKQKLYTLNLGSGGSEKILDYKIYLQIVSEIYNNYGYIPAVISNPSQEYLQETLIEEYLKPNLLPYVKLEPMALEEIGALVLQTKFIVTPDTGILHIAMACEKFILGIFTYTHPDLVDFGNNRLISVYEKFDEGNLWQTQEIKSETIVTAISNLMKKGDF